MQAVTAASAAPMVLVRRVIGGGSDGPTAAGATGSARAPIVKAAVLHASPSAVAHIAASSLVKAVMPDLPTQAAAPARSGCVAPASVGKRVVAKPAASFKWPGCLTAATQLAWVGQACGGGRLQYIMLYAVLRASDKVASSNGTRCVLRRDPARATWTSQRFGSCGRAPSMAPSLPLAVCTTGGGASDFTAGGASNGTSAGNGSSVINSNTTGDPSSDAPVLPRALLAPGESVPPGLTRIGAVTARGVVNATAAGDLVVGVMDSGIDCSHPDISCAPGGLSWIDASDEFANDADPRVDNYGHGTHVAGIIGARNNGAGVVGVVPGLPVLPLKVIDGLGSSRTSFMLAALNWAASEGVQRGVRIINISLTLFIDPSAPWFADAFAAVCAAFARASDAGVVVTASAGNDGASITGRLPASCPSVLATTALNAKNTEPGTYSNWLAAELSADKAATVMAAPGTAILSTVPRSLVADGYLTLTGTSMASPHVAGAAAACFVSGRCRTGATGVDNIAALQQLAQQRRSTMPSSGFAGDAPTTANGRYYGLLAWVQP